MGTKKTAAKKNTVVEFDLGHVGKDWTDLPSGEYGKTWPDDSTKTGNMVEGKIIDFRSGVGKNSQDLFVVKTAKDDLTVWNSAGLSRLFTLGMKAVGLQVRITFEGTKKLTGKRQPMKLFKVAVRR